MDSPSPHSAAALQADLSAFCAFMRHLKQVDAERTVIMVQVENEPGSWGSVRDFSPAAEKLFGEPVPGELLKALGTNAPVGANWTTAFGADAEEYFHAWSVARFIGQVAAAGKKEYPLPMYANAALRDPLTPGPASTYGSGGPTDNVLGIWKVAGVYGKIDFTSITGRKRSFRRVEEGGYENGVFQPVRIWNGDETDWGLSFFSAPQILRVVLSTY